MPKSRRRKDHKERIQRRKVELANAFARKKKEFQKQIEEHQKMLEEQGEIQKVLKEKNKVSDEG